MRGRTQSTPCEEIAQEIENKCGDCIEELLRIHIPDSTLEMYEELMANITQAVSNTLEDWREDETDA